MRLCRFQVRLVPVMNTSSFLRKIEHSTEKKKNRQKEEAECKAEK